ncbi:hypothetical protein GGI21_001706, partial [Coemansia aciculifera]
REPTKDLRDEVMLLRRVEQDLSTKIDAEADIIFPQLEVGGRVQFKLNGKPTEDNTDVFYKKFAEEAKQAPPFRVHRRIVMSPIGEPLHMVESAKELVTVVCDVMRCHSAIVHHCGILHRDISQNNVLVVRRDGIARGLLIDFDCAVDINKEQLGNRRPEMTGTLPFMSINNLSPSSVPRTALDDWESMLYLLCWKATEGVISAKRRVAEDFGALPIGRWRNGDDEAIVNAKRAHMSNKEDFEDQIMDNFNDNEDDNDLLKRLATRFYMALFQNRKVSPDCHGTAKKAKYSTQTKDTVSDSDDDDFWTKSGEIVDPFVERVNEKDVILKTLLVLIDRYWKDSVAAQHAAKLVVDEQANESPAR